MQYEKKTINRTNTALTHILMVQYEFRYFITNDKKIGDGFESKENTTLLKKN